MLIGEVLSNFVDIFFSSYVEEYILEIRSLEISIGDLSIVIRIYHVEYSHYYSICIPILELRCLLKEFKTWMRI